MHQSIQNNIWALPRQTSIKTSSRTSIPWLSPDKHVSACKEPRTNIGSAFHHAAIYHLDINEPVCSAGKIYHNNVFVYEKIFSGTWPFPDTPLSKRAAMIPMAQTKLPPAKSARRFTGRKMTVSFEWKSSQLRTQNCC